MRTFLLAVGLALVLAYGVPAEQEPPIVEYTTTAPCEAPC